MSKLSIALLLSPYESRIPILSFSNNLANDKSINFSSFTFAQSRFKRIRNLWDDKDDSINFDIVFDFRQSLFPKKSPFYLKSKSYVKIDARSILNFPTLGTIMDVTLESPYSPFKITLTNCTPNWSTVSFREGTVQTLSGIRKTDENKLKIILSICNLIIFKKILMKEKQEVVNRRIPKYTINLKSIISLCIGLPVLLLRRVFILCTRVNKKLRSKLFAKKEIDGVIFKKKYNWNIAFSSQPFSVNSQIQYSQLVCPDNVFWADPFIHKINEKMCIFFEEYSSSTQKGHISCIEISEDNQLPVRPVVVEDFHLSFPFIFDYGGYTYMCPETSESNDIRLYKCIDYPLQWKFEKTLVNNIRAADSMIFEHDNKWWLFTNIDSAGIGKHDSELYIFYADSPLTNDWISHPLNPIYTDSRFARNGGFFREKENIYRVSQIKGFNKYANGIKVNRIIRLDEQMFDEIEVKQLISYPGLNNSKIHHLHSNGFGSVLDYFQE